MTPINRKGTFSFFFHFISQVLVQNRSARRKVSAQLLRSVQVRGSGTKVVYVAAMASATAFSQLALCSTAGRQVHQCSSSGCPDIKPASLNDNSQRRYGGGQSFEGGGSFSQPQPCGWRAFPLLPGHRCSRTRTRACRASPTAGLPASKAKAKAVAGKRDDNRLRKLNGTSVVLTMMYGLSHSDRGRRMRDPSKNGTPGSRVAAAALPPGTEDVYVLLADILRPRPVIVEESTWVLSDQAIKTVYMLYACVFTWGCVVFGSMNDPLYDSEEYRSEGGDGTGNWIYENQEKAEMEAREALFREDLVKEIEANQEELGRLP
ncbi:hypothetical protein CBR_g30507 [Chara braunii]|uniref:Uncharacterized protein n=1 Tax=Chara braunii TaxID=69332 RepID=A0A388LCV1_CHABU|nr:hypothetical protein CBR_g30507 [Chara braunii]|eukprot:GBG80139.1 hypothetical protein CBR_g30507 [Chara braunii]